MRSVQRAIDTLRAAGHSLRDATPGAWIAILNGAYVTESDGYGRRVMVRDDQGRPTPLLPQDDEVMPAALTVAASAARWVTVGDVAIAIQERRESDRATRHARVTADREAHGPLLPEGLRMSEPGAVMLEMRWRRAAQDAIGRGASREQAVEAAWREIGLPRPVIEAGPGRPLPARLMPAPRVP